MYSNLKNVEILVALLKKYRIKHIVISAGTRHTPLVVSVENDDFFKTYSIVDERSASFFAIGLIEELQEPVAICCTSGTAAANYVSAANEAFYQQIPLLILTADRNHYYMFQQEEQMIPQENLYCDVCKKVVTLPHVRDEKDFWYCSRIANEALMELHHGESGPVHINFIVENDYPEIQGIVKFEVENLPDVRKTERLSLEDLEEVWRERADFLKQSKILIIYGQHGPHTDEEIKNIESFAEKKFSELGKRTENHCYFEAWEEVYKTIGDNGSLNDIPVDYSAMYATQQFMKRIPQNALLHIANSNSIRLANYFSPKDSIRIFCNRGANGIDGSMSAFVGQAFISGKMSFLLIGDLSFFYDMNSLWSRYIGNNIRIMVCNNSGGAIFHSYPNTTNVPSIDRHIAAQHETSVKDWVISRGFSYYSAKNKEEFDKNIVNLFDETSSKPIVFEVFTDKDTDADSIRTILAPYILTSPSLKGTIAGKLPAGLKNTIKKIIR